VKAAAVTRQVVNEAAEFNPSPAVRSDAWPEPLDLAALAATDPQPPKQIMEGVPVGSSTGSFGHGGAGKSQIELTRAVCIARELPFCDFEVERRRVTFLSCEDRADVLHWRLSRICRHLGIDLASLSGWLNVLDLVGHDSVLFAPDPRQGSALTPPYGFLAEHLRRYGSEVLFGDGISDMFGGNENARGDVKRFNNHVLALIPPDRGAAILVGHVNKATASGNATTEGYSGSTAWHNAFRARWYLRPETEHDEDGQHGRPTGKLIYELQKSNHGEIGAQIEFKWDDDAHLFVGRRLTGSRFDQQHLHREEQRGILHAFAACAAASIIVPSALMGRRTAYHVLEVQPQFPESLRTGGRAKSRRFWRHIEELRRMHAIEECSYRRTSNRHAASQFVLTKEGVRLCAE
jgi:RecA-family ATPase